jgi:hypothetical protein
MGKLIQSPCLRVKQSAHRQHQDQIANQLHCSLQFVIVMVAACVFIASALVAHFYFGIVMSSQDWAGMERNQGEDKDTRDAIQSIYGCCGWTGPSDYNEQTAAPSGELKLPPSCCSPAHMIASSHCFRRAAYRCGCAIVLVAAIKRTVVFLGKHLLLVISALFIMKQMPAPNEGLESGLRRCKLVLNDASALENGQYDVLTHKLIEQMIRATADAEQAKPNHHANQPTRNSDTDITMQRDSITLPIFGK